MGKKSRYEFEDLVYVGKKLYFATPGKVYQIITENIESLIDGGTGYGVKHFNGDDNRIHILSDYRDGNELKFITISEFRDLKINKILK
jgi:hypothetical protein